jgi:hypothetical protein
LFLGCTPEHNGGEVAVEEVEALARLAATLEPIIEDILKDLAPVPNVD